MVFESNSDMFDEDIKKAKYIVVDFWASWCAPCKMMKVILETLSKKLETYNQIKIFSINTDENPEISTRYAINAVPTLLFFKDGKLMKKEAGVKTEEQLVGIFNSMKGM